MFEAKTFGFSLVCVFCGFVGCVVETGNFKISCQWIAVSGKNVVLFFHARYNCETKRQKLQRGIEFQG